MLYNLLYLTPKNWLSRGIGAMMERRWPLGLDTFIRDRMIATFKPEVGEAEHALSEYPTWSAFFTRRLRPGARPIGASPLVSPVDGKLTQRGRLETVPGGAELFLTQVKGLRYSLSGLMAGWETGPYAGGAFLTVYLAPWNYHRIHAPADVRVLRARHVAGALWPVNPWSVTNIRELFVRNDRVLVEMEGEGENAGRMMIALVGATNVGRTTLGFCDLRGNVYSRAGMTDFIPKDDAGVFLRKGDELGCFEMGSTIVLVLDARWAARVRAGLLEGRDALPVRLGENWGEGTLSSTASTSPLEPSTPAA